MNIEINISDLQELFRRIFTNAVGKEDSSNEDIGSSYYKIGDTILVRTVTMIDLGTVVDISPSEIVLKNAGWVADTGRFGECLESGSISEFERAPDWITVNRSSIIDVFPWSHIVPEKSIPST